MRPGPPSYLISNLLDPLRARGDAASMTGRPAGARAGPGLVVPLGLPPYLTQSRGQISEQVGITPPPGAGAGDQHVIGPGPPIACQKLTGRFPQPALCPVAQNRVADLAAGRKTDPHRRAVDAGRARRRLQHQAGTHRAAAGRCDTEKIGAGLQSYKAARHCVLTGGPRRVPSPASAGSGAAESRKARSGRQALAPFGPARSDDAAAAGSRHPRPKAVAALANKPTRLVSAFHGTSDGKLPV